MQMMEHIHSNKVEENAFTVTVLPHLHRFVLVLLPFGHLPVVIVSLLHGSKTYIYNDTEDKDIHNYTYDKDIHNAENKDKYDRKDKDTLNDTCRCSLIVELM